MDLLRPLWIRAAQKVTEWASPQGAVKNYFIYYQPAPYIHRETSPLHHYTISSITSAAEFARVSGADFRGDAAALDSALRDFFWTTPTPQESEIVLLTPGWAGHYTVTENTAPTVLTIQITPRGSPLA
jgi:hypothetical protein